MAWTTPKTFTANSPLTASDLNTYLRDNFNETPPAKATTPGGVFVTTGLNAITERIPGTDYVATSEATATTTYVNLVTVGPTVTCTTGTQALVILYCTLSSSSATGRSWMAYGITGATTIAASTDRAIGLDGTGLQTIGAMFLQTGLTAGSNTFQAKYTATSATSTFATRRLSVIPL